MFRFKTKSARKHFVDMTAFKLLKRITETGQKWNVESFVWNALDNAETVGNKESMTREYLDQLTADVKQSTITQHKISK